MNVRERLERIERNLGIDRPAPEKEECNHKWLMSGGTGLKTRTYCGICGIDKILDENTSKTESLGNKFTRYLLREDIPRYPYVSGTAIKLASIAEDYYKDRIEQARIESYRNGLNDRSCGKFNQELEREYNKGIYDATNEIKENFGKFIEGKEFTLGFTVSRMREVLFGPEAMEGKDV